ncbi:glycosyltransferase family 4 protein [Desulfosudis oleivorans]|uniref:Glycosyl transferase group 1 n=1 Tax=Desulfosudis oleivorans (strain DSM 6200 / JCM 39069 / Hxd3) TaxID=96561 RepID=A9A0Y1_DESOH|nr:glycosyltransferase family 4 protein [Desulfosudis oleivorans]ABW67606.1 glycosyl transferase group 1 [Desulfosudis oleivorans Hxd3]
MATKPHICFVAPMAWPVLCEVPGLQAIGGAELQQVLLARELAHRGYPVTMITFDFGQAENAPIDGIRVLKTVKPGQGIPFVRFFHPNISSLWKAMQKADADIYYQRTAAYLTGVVCLFARRHKKKFVYAGAHDSDFVKGSELLAHARDRWLFRYGLQRADAVIVQNGQQEKDCARNYSAAPFLVPNFYPMPKKQAENKGAAILWVGTMRPFKRPELFLDLAGALPEHRFIMIGGADPSRPDYYRAIRQQAEKHDNLDFLGFQPLDETEKAFDRAALFVNTSLQEGFPNTFLQAWARGVPTVSFFSPFTGSNDNRPGIYVNTPEELARNVAHLMNTPGERQTSGEQYRQYYLDHFSPNAVVPQYEAIINRLV